MALEIDRRDLPNRVSHGHVWSPEVLANVCPP
jgi:hypothetical protein